MIDSDYEGKVLNWELADVAEKKMRFGCREVISSRAEWKKDDSGQNKVMLGEQYSALERV